MEDEEQVSPWAVRAQLDRIERSPHLAESGRLAVLLRHLVEEALAGNAAALKEAAIGNAVYAREPAYDPRFDSTVRVEARRLRRKLAAFYAAPGDEDRVEIALPTGSYVPRFSWLRPGRPSAAGAAREAEAQETQARERRAQETGTFREGSGAVVAVLPFTPLSGAPEDVRFADELTDELIYAMEQAEGFRIASRRMAFQYRNKEYSTAAVARELGADAVLQGTVRRRAEGLRVTVELSDPSGLALWSDRFDADADAPQELQDKIAATIVSRIRFDTSRMRAGELGATPLALKVNAQVYRARQLLDAQTPRDLARALALFTQVSEAAGDYARGFSGIADCVCDQFRLGLVGREAAHAAARPAAARALGIDPLSVEAHTAMATVHAWLEWDRAAAEAAFQKAMALGDGARTTRLYGVFLAYCGHHGEAGRLFARARRLEPISTQQDCAEALCRFQARDFDALVAAAGSAGPAAPEALFYRGLAGALGGAPQAALACAARLDAAEADYPLLATAAAELRAWAGDGEGAGTGAPAGRASSPSRFARATLAVATGALDAALDHLEAALAARELGVVWIGTDPRFDALRARERFAGILARLRPSAPA